MKKITILLCLTIFLLVSNVSYAAKMEDGVPVWDEKSVRVYALEYISGKHMEKLYSYFDLQIRRYMPVYTYESMFLEMEHITGDFVGLGTYSQFEDEKNNLKTHILHICMEKQDVDMYFTHKNYEDDWEVMAVEFILSEKQEPLTLKEMDFTESEYLSHGPSSFTETEIEIGAEDAPIGATLTMPDEASETNPVPALVLVHDYYALDRDTVIGNSAFFKDLAHGFAEMGIATLRYDAREYVYGKSETSTIYDDVVADALSAGKYLANNAKIDTEHLVLLGHGIGGTYAPLIVSQSEKLFKGMILLAAKPEKILLQDYEYYLKKNPSLSTEEKKEIEKQVKKFNELSKKQASEITLLEKNGSYYYELDEYKIATTILKLAIPTVIAQGKQDLLVDENDGRYAFYDYIQFRNYVEYHTFRRLNHVLTTDNTVNAMGLPTYEAPQNIDKQAVRMLARWMFNFERFIFGNEDSGF